MSQISDELGKHTSRIAMYLGYLIFAIIGLWVLSAVLTVL